MRQLSFAELPSWCIRSRSAPVSAPLHFAFGDLGADVEGDAHAEIGEAGFHRRLQSRAVLGLGQFFFERDEIGLGVRNA